MKKSRNVFLAILLSGAFAAAAAETVGALIRQLRHSSEPPPHRPIPYRITDRGSIARR